MASRRRLPVLAFALAATVGLGARAAEQAGDVPDLSGVWSKGMGVIAVAGGGEVPFQPWAKDIYDRTNAAMKAGANFVDNRTICLPDGGVDAMFPGYLIRFVQTPQKLHMLFEFNNQMRTVFLNGTHPADLKPSWYGHSTGRWEGNTLVVETVALNDRTPLMTLFLGGSTRTNMPHTDQLRMTERFTLSDDGKTLTNAMTIDDPGAFTQPWTVELVSTRRDDRQLMEFVCADDPALTNPDEPISLDGLIQVGRDGKAPFDK